MKLLFMGAPGCGKGTQAQLVSERIGIPAVSTGALLRSAIAQGTQAGLQAKEYMDRGCLVPDEVVVRLLLDRLTAADCSAGYILDGFPRTQAQAEMLEQEGVEVDKAIMLAASDEEIIKRTAGRRVCTFCGDTYHTQFNRPQREGICDKCGDSLTVREDDKPETVRNRLNTYHQITKPVISYYEERGKLVKIPADKSVEDVSELVLSELGTGEGL